MCLVATALGARLPLIRVESDDLVHIQAILAHYAGGDVKAWTLGKMKPKEWRLIPKNAIILYPIGDAPEDPAGVYDTLVDLNSTLILVNVPENPAYFNIGPLPTPPAMILEMLEDFTENPNQVARALGGMNLKEAIEIVTLTQTRYSDSKPEHVVAMRREVEQDPLGIIHVDSAIPYYWEEPWVEKWLKVEGPLLLDPTTPAQLVPRGLLFKGPAGTGKTLGAKYIASELEIPLFALDVSTLMTKWLGESTSNLTRALAKVDSYAPCVLLIDEAEKLFQSSNDAGESLRTLARLLWWLQERRSRVFVCLTTNDSEKLPPELHRPGRIDYSVTFEGLPRDAVHRFMNDVGYSIVGPIIPSGEFDAAAGRLLQSDRDLARITQAEATQATKDSIKWWFYERRQELQDLNAKS